MLPTYDMWYSNLNPKGRKIPIVDLFAGFQEKTLSIDKANEKSVTDRD